jgi:hypothetical protein
VTITVTDSCISIMRRGGSGSLPPSGDQKPGKQKTNVLLKLRRKFTRELTQTVARWLPPEGAEKTASPTQANHPGHIALPYLLKQQTARDHVHDHAQDLLLNMSMTANTLDEVWQFLPGWLGAHSLIALWLTVNTAANAGQNPQLVLTHTWSCTQQNQNNSSQNSNELNTKFNENFNASTLQDSRNNRHSLPHTLSTDDNALDDNTLNHNTLNHNTMADTPMATCFSSGDTAFCHAPKHLPAILRDLLPAECQQPYLFSIPLTVGGHHRAVLTLAFNALDVVSQGAVAKVYGHKHLLAQLIWRCYQAGQVTPYVQEVAQKTLMMALVAKDPYTSGHSQAVCHYADKLANYLQLPPDDIKAIHLAAQLHDIGKLGIPDAILNKPSPLTEDEWAIMRKHPEIGANMILRHIPELAQASDYVLHHHERWDGSGYPDGLAGEAISLGAQIVSIVDVYHGLTSNRSYRQAMPVADVITMMETQKGLHWRPELVDAFIRIINSQVECL